MWRRNLEYRTRWDRKPKPRPAIVVADRQAVMAQLEAGETPRSFQGLEQDKEVFRCVAQYAPPSVKQQLFLKASMLLRGKPDFMQEILEIDPSLFVCGTVDMQQDQNLALYVFSQSPQVVLRYLEDLNKLPGLGKRDRNDRKEFVRWLCQQLGRMLGALGDGVIRKIIDSTRLNQDDDTSDHFQRLIFQYICPWEVPSVRFLRQARQSYHNLKAVMDHPCLQPETVGPLLTVPPPRVDLYR